MREISRTELRSYRDYFVSVCDREKERESERERGKKEFCLFLFGPFCIKVLLSQA